MSTARPPNPGGQTRHEAVVESQLRRARQRIRLLDVTSAALGLVVAALGYGLILSILDSWLLLPGWCRQTAFAVFGLLALAYLAGAVIPPLFRRVNPYYAAQQVERTIPEAKNSVVNWLDLRAQPLPPAIRVAVSQKAARDISHADLEHAISARRASWLGGITTGLVIAVGILFFVAGPQQFLSLLGHAFLPFSSQGALSTRTSLELIQPEGGNVTVAPYHAVNFMVEVKGKMPATDGPDAIRLLYRYDLNGHYEEMPFSPGDSSREWVAMMAGSDLHNGFWYKVKGGDYESPEYQVRVRSVPLIARFEIHYHYPSYLRMPDVDDANPNLIGMRGSDVSIVARTNCVVRSGWLEVLGQKVPLDGELVENNRALRFKLRLEKDERYRIHFTSAEGDNNPEVRPYTISVHNDLPPLVHLTSPDKTEVHLPLNGVLQVAGYADDDFGLTGMRLWLKVNGEEPRTIPYRSGKSWQQKDGSYPRHLDYADFVDIGTLRLKDGSRLQKGMVLDYCLEATDNCAYPPPGPNVGRSQPLHHVVLDDPLPPQAAQQQKSQAQKETQKKQDAQDKQMAQQGNQGQSSEKKQGQGQSSENNGSGKSEKNGSGTVKQNPDQKASSAQNTEKGDRGSSNSGKNSENSAGTGQGGQQQNQSNSQSDSGGSPIGKNDLQDKLKKAQDWLKDHQNKPDKNSPPDKGSSAQEQNGESSTGSKSSRSQPDSKPDKGNGSGGSTQSGQTQKPNTDQRAEQNSGENHSASDAPKNGPQEAGKGAKEKPTTSDGGASGNGSNKNKPDKKAQAGTNPMPETQTQQPSAQSAGGKPKQDGSDKKTVGADRQEKGNAEQGSQAGAKQHKSGSSAGAGAHSKPERSSEAGSESGTQPNGTDHSTQPKGGGQGTQESNPAKGASAGPPKEGTGQSSSDNKAPDKKQDGSTTAGGANATPKPSDTGGRAGQPKPGNPQSSDKGGRASEKTDHAAPEKGPPATAPDHGTGPDGQHTPAAGPKNQSHEKESGSASPHDKAAQQQKLEKDLSDTLKGLQGKTDQELRDLMKKLHSQDPATRKNAGQKLEDEIRQASKNPEIRKRSEDLLKRLQRLNQENPQPSTGTTNANGSEGNRGPTGHQGSRNQAGNSGNKIGPDSPSIPGTKPKGNNSSSVKNAGKGNATSSDGGKGNSQGSAKGNRGEPGSGRGSARGRNNIAQQPGDNNGPGPGDGTHANGVHNGTDENGFQPGQADPANKEFQKKAGVLQLQEFPKNPPKALLRDLHLSEKDWEALRKAQASLIKERQQQASHDTLPPVGSGGRGLRDLKAHQIKSGKDEKDLGFSGAIHPPPGFGDTYRDFTRKGSNMPEGK